MISVAFDIWRGCERADLRGVVRSLENGWFKGSSIELPLCLGAVGKGQPWGEGLVLAPEPGQGKEAVPGHA